MTLGFLPWVLEGSLVCSVHTNDGLVFTPCPVLSHFLHLETPLDSRSWYNRWRICCDKHLLLKWQQLQALQRDGPLALERGANPQVSLLPLNLSFLTFLQAVLRVIVVIR